MLTEATRQNLTRKAHWADHVQVHDGVPLPSWIDISPSDICNRACVFCPRVDPTVAPNNNLHMSIALGRKIADELRSWQYEGAVVFCGTGEPLLHPKFVELVSQFWDVHTEVVTNGDRLTPALVGDLFDAGLSYINVSCYDGPHQIGHFNEVFAGWEPHRFTLRDRWHGADEDYGLKLTNRAGTIHAGNQLDVDATSRCFYPSYCLTLDWDARALLCPQDFDRKLVFGSVAQQSMLEIWTSRALGKRRTKLMQNREGVLPCKDCNACGTLHGAAHVDAWRSTKESGRRERI